MDDANEVPERIYRAVFAGIVCYFGLFAVGTITGSGLVLLAAEVVFGVIAVGLGTMLYMQSGGEPSLLFASAICLIAGGALQFALLLSGLAILGVLSSIAVFAGIGLYIYVIWVAQ
ncbi:hypothetical protein D8Y22_10865 [Salinadaptatus halalkaliphilus]|uniref:Uncharacterized protein n=1 Tax=Salinadaptatus halalkaliphilus TaxID=2419781 RepID=A0A4S3TL35_9EURY|nr:hypothetical protein [Salinadaptatus halalkaliphilus]THE64864.1 hypothetical protein D8Y22_10865 [Salinadaptatus halalkaliphilus]